MPLHSGAGSVILIMGLFPFASCVWFKKLHLLQCMIAIENHGPPSFS